MMKRLFENDRYYRIMFYVMIIVFTVFIFFLLTSCKKEYNVAAEIQPLQINYVVNVKDSGRKHVSIFLWSANDHSVIAVKDTVITKSCVISVLNKEYIRQVITDFVVCCMDKPDTMNQTIYLLGREKPLIYHSYSCQTDSIVIKNEYMSLYRDTEYK